jgi:chromosome segregation ATPase
MTPQPTIPLLITQELYEAAIETVGLPYVGKFTGALTGAIVGAWKGRVEAGTLQLSVREHCRQRKPIGGPDAQALEHAITITERERDDLRAQLAEANRHVAEMQDSIRNSAERRELEVARVELSDAKNRGRDIDIALGKARESAQPSVTLKRGPGPCGLPKAGEPADETAERLAAMVEGYEGEVTMEALNKIQLWQDFSSSGLAPALTATDPSACWLNLREAIPACEADIRANVARATKSAEERIAALESGYRERCDRAVELAKERDEARQQLKAARNELETEIAINLREDLSKANARADANAQAARELARARELAQSSGCLTANVELLKILGKWK